MSTPSNTSHNDFESSLSELENIVTQMEQGNLSLDEALSAFETGIKLTRHCQTILDQAEQKIQVLTEKNGEINSTPFSLSEQG
ncbi:MAG: exodeoxyribonuclease VII small subunit [Pontibacterium sp.]